MQLDVDVSPPANIMTFRLGLTARVTFDPDMHACHACIREKEDEYCFSSAIPRK